MYIYILPPLLHSLSEECAHTSCVSHYRISRRSSRINKSMQCQLLPYTYKYSTQKHSLAHADVFTGLEEGIKVIHLNQEGK